MTPGEIRVELLSQHADLRRKIEEVLGIAARAAAGQPVAGALRDAVAGLGEAVRAHNEREEELLRDLIATVDAWGAVRAEILTESHLHEHEELRKAVEHIPATPVEFAGAGVAVLFDRLLEHMDREERTVLSEDVLRDDPVVVDIGG